MRDILRAARDEAREAFRRYGQHDQDCRHWREEMRVAEGEVIACGDCSCGFENAWRRLDDADSAVLPKPTGQLGQ